MTYQCGFNENKSNVTFPFKKNGSAVHAHWNFSEKAAFFEVASHFDTVMH